MTEREQEVVINKGVAKQCKLSVASNTDKFIFLGYVAWLAS